MAPAAYTPRPYKFDCFNEYELFSRDRLLFVTRNRTPPLHNNIEERWLTERLRKMGSDEPRMGWHAFRRFRKTWLRGKRCQEDINIFWMGHKPKTMSEVYSHLFEEVGLRLEHSHESCSVPDVKKRLLTR